MATIQSLRLLARACPALFAVLIAWAACAAPARAADAPAVKDGAAAPVILLTGFEVFGDYKINASWETVKTFQGKTVGGYRIETACLPVVYDEMAAPLKAAVEKHKPAVVICFGVGSRVPRIETLARNGYHPARPKDNKGQPPPRKEVEPGAPETLPTQLPAAAIVAALKKAGRSVAESDDAGGYLCNECFYRLMRLDPKTGGANILARGFVHVPDIGWPDPAGGAFTLEKLQHAVDTVVGETIKSVTAKKGTEQK